MMLKQGCRAREVLLLFLLLTGVFFLAPTSAHAGYLDPGSGSIFVQVIVSFFAFWGRLFAKVKSFFKKDGGND